MSDSRQGELFGDGKEPSSGIDIVSERDAADMSVIAGLYSSAGVDLSALPENSRRLFELSVNAFETVVNARMSELPIAAEIAYFEQKIIAAADAVLVAAGTGPASQIEIESAQRRTAETAATDRGDANVRIVQEAAYKVWHEVHRLLGLLRFCPDAEGVYIARCEPDHFVLPAFGPHFKERFGETPWTIIDEKRRLCLSCRAGGPIMFKTYEGTAAVPDGEWGNLWRHYHKTINNESRNNPALQRQFLPTRYWKYLNELN